MARKASTVEDVVLGEAAVGTPQERLADMIAVASVIANRAAALGVDPSKVVSVKSEFNAYGKSLPPGAERFRGLAREAVETVARNGPVHSATFFATPAAKHNLPNGLSKVHKTTGHEYFSDPKNRAIKTAEGSSVPAPSHWLSSPTQMCQSQRPGQRSRRLPLLRRCWVNRHRIRLSRHLPLTWHHRRGHLHPRR